MSLPAGARFVQWLARLAAFAYPPAFRRLYGPGFPEVALHRWRRETRRRSPLGATMATTRVLMADTAAESAIWWMTAASDENETTPTLRSVCRRAGRWLGDGGRDVFLAARTLARRPAASALIVLTLGLGIGASTAAFDALDRAVWHALPFEGGDRLVFLSMRDRLRDSRYMPSADQFRRFRDAAKSIERIEIFEESSFTRLTNDGAVVSPSLSVTAGLPSMLNIRPVIGRMIAGVDAADGAAAVVMVTETFWRRELGADPAVIGRVMNLASGPATIVGVWPEGARLNPREVPDLIVPIPESRQISKSRFSYLLTRLAPGATRAEAERELTALTQAPPDSVESPALDSQAFLFLGRAYEIGVWLVFAGACALLLVAIANAAVLLLDQSARRGRELGIRLALGSSGLRLLRLFLAEGLAYATAGIVTGLGVAVTVEAAVARYEPRLFSTLRGGGLSGRALWFACAAAALVAIVCAVAPVYRLRSSDVREALAESGTRVTAPRRRVQRGLVAVQTMLAVLLLSGAALMARSFTNLMRVDTGLAIDHLAELTLAPPTSRYPTPEAKKAYLAQASETLRSMPGVTGITTAAMPLLSASVQVGQAYLEGEPVPTRADESVTVLVAATPGYFDVMGIHPVAGRLFDPSDQRDVAIVNEAFARSRGNDVLGRRIYTPMGKAPATIVGVVNDIRVYGLTTARDHAQIYMPFRSFGDTWARFVVRTTGDPDAFLRDARQRLASLDHAVPVLGPHSGPEVFHRETAQHRFVAVLLLSVAGLGLMLALSGIYGTVALSVSHRTREMGIRLALGAAPGGLRRTFVRAELVPVLIGGVVGSVAAWYVAPLMEALLFRVAPHDPLSGLLAFVAVAVTATLAAAVPARRLSRIDPALTLRAL